MFRVNVVSPKWVASFCALIFSGAQGLVIALYPFLAERLHLSLSLLIASFSLGSFLFVLGSPYWATRSDQWGRARVLKIGMSALLVSFGMVTFLVKHPFESSNVNLAILLLSRILYGLVASSIPPVAQSLQADLGGEKGATHAMLRHSLSLSVGRVAGVSLLVFFSHAMVSVLFAYLLSIAFVLGFASFLKTSSQVALHPTAEASWKSEFLKVKWIIAMAFLFTCFVEALNASLAGNIQAIFNLESGEAGVFTAKILLTASVGVLLVQTLGRFFSGLSWRLGLVAGVLALLGGAILYRFTQSRGELWIAMAFLIMGIGVLPPFYLSVLRKDCPPSQYGKRAGVVGSAHTLGYAFGGGLVSLAFHLGVHQTGALLVGIVTVLGIVVARQLKEAS